MNALDKVYPGLYGSNYDKKDMDERFESLMRVHEELFGAKSEALFSTAGRTELAGNHTDHNLGRVIAGTINLDTIAAVSLRADERIIIRSEGFPSVDVDTSDLTIREEEKNTTHALIRGIAKAFRDRGLTVKGFQANTTTRVLKGSGLSSSAAIEVLIGEIINSLFNDNILKPVEIAKIGQYAENVYFGKPSGLMDQIGCAEGGVVGIDFKDKANPVLTPLSVDFSAYGLNLVIVDTKGNHASLTPDYAAVPSEMRSVAAFFGEETLRAVDYEEFLSCIPALREKLGNDRAVLRAYHYFNENRRVEKMLKALERKDIKTYLKLVKESGRSSFEYLQNVYSTTDVGEQGLPLALAMAEEILGDEGAYRVHGGGFAGTIQAYVPDEKLEEFVKKMDALFGASSLTVLAIRKLPTARIL
jgi:Galactokinase